MWNLQGAVTEPDGSCTFRVWAPLKKKVELHLVSPEDRMVPLRQVERGYWQARVENVPAGARYLYRLDGKVERPDPASRCQPEGVHKPSEVVSRAFPWDDECWRGIPRRELVFYELHVGTFTQEGTFEAIIPHLPWLKQLGITAIELMPVSQFPGERNWGYDGVYMYAAQHSYGGVDGLRRLVNEAHKIGFAIFIDVVYNHLGPEGNYIAEFAPYFTDQHITPWGSALNYDSHHSDEVRRFFIGNALYWLEECHADGLRLDAVHSIMDLSARTFLEELAWNVHEAAARTNRHMHVVAENDLNDTRYVQPTESGGMGLDANWNDDFQHAVFTQLYPDARGYYEDYGKLSDFVKAYEHGYVLDGCYSAYRKKSHGRSSRLLHGSQLVVFLQNHDQVGNRPAGERIGHLTGFEQLKVGAAAVILAPALPLLFMGEEYNEPAPFLYFVSHGDEALIEAVRKGRAEEFSHFFAGKTPPDPQGEETFQKSKLNTELRKEGAHKQLFEWHRELLRLRRTTASLFSLDKLALKIRPYEQQQTVVVHRWSEEDEVIIIFNFSDKAAAVAYPVPEGIWTRAVDSSDAMWGGQGATSPEKIEAKGITELTACGHSCVVYKREIA